MELYAMNENTKENIYDPNIYRYDTLNIDKPRVMISSLYKMEAPEEIPDLLCYPGEYFVWVTHSPITPNVFYHRYLVSNYGRVYNTYLKMFQNNSPNRYDGYIKVRLGVHISFDKTATADIPLHRLVAFFFLYFPGCESLFVNHKDGNKSNNMITNLEWVTGSENMQHAGIMGLVPTGSKRAEVILTDEDVHKACQYMLSGHTIKETAEHIGCSIYQIKDIRYNGAYKHISEMYDFSKIEKTIGKTKKDDIEKVHNVCKALQSRQYTIGEISRMYGVSKTFVCSINNRETHTDISCQYDLPGKQKRKDNLNEAKVIQICELLSKGDKTREEIANIVNVPISCVSNLKLKRVKQWKHITDRYEFNVRVHNTPLSDSQVITILKNLKDGKSITEVANKFNLNYWQIQCISNGDSYKHIDRSKIK